MMNRILVIDNYDSFTYNLVHLVEEITGDRPPVLRNDAAELEVIEKFDSLLLSPGPGIPGEAGKLKEIIGKFATSKKILGVCLGHQAIAEVFGAKLKNLETVFHGVQTGISAIEKHPMFEGIENPVEVGRYHSWVVERNSMNSKLKVLAEDDDNEVMALCHTEYPVWGVQFHPESIMTAAGEQLLGNWIES